MYNKTMYNNVQCNSIIIYCLNKDVDLEIVICIIIIYNIIILFIVIRIIYSCMRV